MGWDDIHIGKGMGKAIGIGIKGKECEDKPKAGKTGLQHRDML